MYGLWGLGLMALTKALIVVDTDVNVHDLGAVATAVINNVDWRRDVTMVDGPVDQLDHSAIQNSYGGKMGLDATRKPDRGPLRDCTSIAPERITQLVGEHWHLPRESVLIVGLDKTRRPVHDLLGALWAVCPDTNLIVLDQDVNAHDLSEVAWRVLGNVDWRRDIVINTGVIDHFAGNDTPPGQVGIDATAKGPADGHPRGWPPETVMSDVIKRRVDEKWAQYGIG
jgi:4-hydroxy-3-polyprenylbenzoate decarboxylase